MNIHSSRWPGTKYSCRSYHANRLQYGRWQDWEGGAGYKRGFPFIFFFSLVLFSFQLSSARRAKNADLLAQILHAWRAIEENANLAAGGNTRTYFIKLETSP